MRSWTTRMLITTVALASIAGGPAASALARPHHARHHHALRATRASDPATSERAGENAGEQAQAGEADNDSAQQAAACQRAGVDPNGSNVQYDGQTGTCSANGGSANGGGGGGGDQTQQ